jgi:VWFA-related protein
MQSRLVLNALGEAADFASGFEGKKNLIWFTPGIQWMTHYRPFRFDEVACVNDETLRLHQAYARLAAAQVALTPIDPHGITNDPQFGAGVGRPLSGPQAGGAAFGFNGNVDNDYASRKDFADATGGIPYAQRNDLDRAIGEAIATGSDYYSLAYVPPLSKYDDKYHTIEVKVDRPGLNLRYRVGYTSLDTEAATPSH